MTFLLSSCSGVYVDIPTYGTNEVVEIIVDKELSPQQSELIMEKLNVFADSKQTSCSALSINGRTFITFGPVTNVVEFTQKAQAHTAFRGMRVLSGRQILLPVDGALDAAGRKGN